MLPSSSACRHIAVGCWRPIPWTWSNSNVVSESAWTPSVPLHAELLHVLMLPDIRRANRIVEFWGYPESRAPLLSS
jgi:hypothetical protein